MNENSNFEINVDRIYDNLELLENGHVYEVQKTPGIPKCATLANRIRDDFEVIVKELEENRGWEVILSAGTQKREKIVQRVIHLSGIAYIQANNLSLSCEADEGRGPVDFKISRGQDITVIEVKLSSNDQYMHGYDTQVEEYAKAEQTDNMIYVLVDVGNPVKVKKLLERYNRDIDEGKKVPEVIMIDSTSKESASIT